MDTFRDEASRMKFNLNALQYVYVEITPLCLLAFIWFVRRYGTPDARARACEFVNSSDVKRIWSQK